MRICFFGIPKWRGRYVLVDLVFEFLIGEEDIFFEVHEGL